MTNNNIKYDPPVLKYDFPQIASSNKKVLEIKPEELDILKISPQFNKLYTDLNSLEKSRASCLIKNEINNSRLNSFNYSNSNILSSNFITHSVQCNHCQKFPIKGHRYKCPKCLNYNLCEECDEKNSEENFHLHENFILIRKPEVENENNNNNQQYSIECLNEEMKFSIEKKIDNNDEGVISIKLKNNGRKFWEGNGETELKCDKEYSSIFCKKAVLPPLNQGEEGDFEIIFDKLKNVPKGEYECFLDFFIEGRKTGNKLKLLIQLK